MVCKVDQLVKRRAKSGLIRVNVDWSDAKEFINQHLGKEIKVRLVSSYWEFHESKELITSVKRPRAKFCWLLQTMYLIIAWAFFVLLQTKYLELGTYLFKILRFKSIQVMVRLHTFARNEIIGKICNQTMLERTLVYCMFDLVWPVLNEASSR